MNTNTAATDTHRDDCTGKGFRYAATIRRTSASIANGTADKVLMICKDPKCPARRYV